jgi:spoIIIJ-associated protein
MVMEQSEIGRKWLTQLLEILAYPTVVNIEDEVNNHNRSGCSLVIDRGNLRPHQIQALIGTDGVTIDAIQHLANTCLNSHLTATESSFFYIVELNGYRQERQVTLEAIAKDAIAYVTENDKNYEIKNLSAAERRLVHIFFEDYPQIETFSEGKDPNRYLVVRLLNPDPENLTTETA